MNILDQLKTIGLNPTNSIVIGSGILDALGIRQSNDVDIVIDKNTYEELLKLPEFNLIQSRNRLLLTYENTEIGHYWEVLGKEYMLKDLIENSVVINGVRYINLEFLLLVKKSWLADDTVRQKDIQDVTLIETYLANHRKIS